MAYPHFTWDYELTAANNTLRVTVTAESTQDLTIPAGVYRWQGDGSADDLEKALQDGLNSHGWLGTWTVTYTDTTGALRIQYSRAGNATIEWSHANTTLPEWLFGFEASDVSSGGIGVNPDISQDYGTVGGAWYPARYSLDATYDETMVEATFEPVAPQTETVVFGGVRYQDLVIPMVHPAKARHQYALDSTWAAAAGLSAPDLTAAFDGPYGLWRALMGDSESAAGSIGDGYGVYYYHSGALASEEGPYWKYGSRGRINEWCEREQPASARRFRVSVFMRGASS